ncbi:MAG: mercuric transporter MerT family protein [Bacteriovoracaceae bacterium]|jgi:mercuric ion transport protein|nr:mercuric transporter MerT family protein [Bacteriovoracaceae bacterium]
MDNKAQRATLLGGVIASIVAASCCIGPLIFAVLGVSSARLLSKMEPYRPYLTVLTLVLLGLAFFYTYKKKPADECEDGSYCANPKSDKWNKRILWIATVLILGFLTFPYWSIYLV